MLRCVFVLACSLLPGLLLVSRAEAAPEPAEDCSLADLGVHDESEIQAFDRALRTALENQNPRALAKLAQFPLRVTYPEGQHVVVRDAMALQNELNVPALHALKRHLEAPPAPTLFL